MRGLASVALAVVIALSVAAVALAIAPPTVIHTITSTGTVANTQTPGATVTLSSTKAGARPVRLAIKLPAVLQCGYPRGGAVVVTLPQASRVPHAIGRAVVKVNGKLAGGVAVVHRSVTVAMPRPGGMLCDSITDGTMLVAIGAGANLVNPPQAGTYKITIKRGPASYAAPITIR
jgi:hypothetical protein